MMLPFNSDLTVNEAASVYVFIADKRRGPFVSDTLKKNDINLIAYDYLFLSDILPSSG